MPVQTDVLRVPANGIEVTVAVRGDGPALLLLHGFPHTWRLWSEIIEPLSRDWKVIAPDLRGLGATTRAADGYDGTNLALDAEELLAALNETSASIVATDAGVPPALLLAIRRPDLVRRLVLIEAVLGGLPGAEGFTAGGPPWWFGFHGVPGLAERVLLGHEAEYVDWFLAQGTMGRGINAAIRDEFVSAYTGSDALRSAFAHYRAMPTTARQIQAAVTTRRLTMPTLAIGAHPVGGALHAQLSPIAEDLRGHVIEDCGHIVALDRPQVLLGLLSEFLSAG